MRQSTLHLPTAILTLYIMCINRFSGYDSKGTPAKQLTITIRLCACVNAECDFDNLQDDYDITQFYQVVACASCDDGYDGKWDAYDNYDGGWDGCAGR